MNNRLNRNICSFFVGLSYGAVGNSMLNSTSSRHLLKKPDGTPMFTTLECSVVPFLFGSGALFYGLKERDTFWVGMGMGIIFTQSVLIGLDDDYRSIQEETSDRAYTAKAEL